MAVVKTKNKRKLVAEINVVPYIDVMLVLLIVFMITAPLLMQGVKVELPQAPSTPLEETDKEPLIVSIKADGSYYMDLGNGENQQEELEVIKDKVAKVLAVQPKTPVLVWGDTNVPYGTVVELMTVLQSAGAPNVGLVTEPPSGKK
ncbi:MAG: protein TolR [Porticoccaceae bacterium]|jgi:biopolymer transport protein TolR|nr:protein TolR [Porticoccaceae bacterium]MEA3299232.1 protein TolR [Pseudomonadota bacterium]HLS98843.1 protein TolR [Porticoccaceae bacterium]